MLLIRIPWHEVSEQNEVRTARYLEGLLSTHGIPYRTVLVSSQPSPL